jgi:hypothetical protein
MERFIQRVIVLALALGVTLAVFLFWGKLGYAFRTAMEIVYAEPKPAAQPASDPNEVTAIIITSPAKPACTKDHPCPAPKP